MTGTHHRWSVPDSARARRGGDREESAGRLKALKKAHATAASGPSPRAEDYIEVIYELILEKGYARIIDIGQHLAVSSPTVTKMIQKLDENGLVAYERYRGVALTDEGVELAKLMRHRHGLLTKFLLSLGVDEATSHRDTEGIEHHLDPSTLERVAELVAYMEAHPEWWARFRESQA